MNSVRNAHGTGWHGRAVLSVAALLVSSQAHAGWTITNPTSEDNYQENYDVLCYGEAPENGSCVVEFQIFEPTLEQWLTVAGPEMVSAQNSGGTWSWNKTLRTAEAGEYRLELQPYPGGTPIYSSFEVLTP